MVTATSHTGPGSTGMLAIMGEGTTLAGQVGLLTAVATGVGEVRATMATTVDRSLVPVLLQEIINSLRQGNKIIIAFRVFC